MIEIMIFNETMVHKKELFASGFFCKSGLTYIARDPNRRRFLLAGDELLLIIFPKNLDNTLAEFAGL